MGTTPSHLGHLINDRQVIFTPYDPSCLKGDYYILHMDNWFRYYDEDYDFNYGSTSKEDHDDEPITLTKKYGYYLEPNRMAWTYLKETVYCPNYEINILTSEDYAKYGFSVTNYVLEDNRMRIDFMTNRAIRLYPNDAVCKACVSETDSSTMAVPIGGIIGWRGGAIPYGYTLCNGSNGSPNLVDQFIMGGASTGSAGVLVDGDHPQYPVYRLVFIMRYK